MEDHMGGVYGIHWVLVGKTESKYYLEGLGVDMRVLLQGSVQEYNWIHGGRERGKWQAFVNMVMNLILGFSRLTEELFSCQGLWSVELVC
jgi:hypothetical protein